MNSQSLASDLIKFGLSDRIDPVLFAEMFVSEAKKNNYEWISSIHWYICSVKKRALNSKKLRQQAKVCSAEFSLWGKFPSETFHLAAYEGEVLTLEIDEGEG